MFWKLLGLMQEVTLIEISRRGNALTGPYIYSYPGVIPGFFDIAAACVHCVEQTV
jgi:hypothetical protein